MYSRDIEVTIQWGRDRDEQGDRVRGHGGDVRNRSDRRPMADLRFGQPCAPEVNILDTEVRADDPTTF